LRHVYTRIINAPSLKKYTSFYNYSEAQAFMAGASCLMVYYISLKPHLSRLPHGLLSF
jgi:hypothetical protein